MSSCSNAAAWTTTNGICGDPEANGALRRPYWGEADGGGPGGYAGGPVVGTTGPISGGPPGLWVWLAFNVRQKSVLDEML